MRNVMRTRVANQHKRPRQEPFTWWLPSRRRLIDGGWRWFCFSLDFDAHPCFLTATRPLVARDGAGSWASTTLWLGRFVCTGRRVPLSSPVAWNAVSYAGCSRGCWVRWWLR